jgi:predicted nucleotidyltransferase component of viral defense system
MSRRKDYSAVSGGDRLKPLKNLAASVHQRLKNVARQTNRSFNEIVQYYALERWLYRLAQSKYHDRVFLKGALMLLVWKTPLTRPTRDIDLLGRINNSSESIAKFVAEVSQTAVQEDAMTFDVSKLTVESVTEDADYFGRRAKFIGWLGGTRLPMQIDIGFSDVITPDATTVDYPTILDQPAPQLSAYNRETAIAEKFHAMVKLGELNSRMKDFFDVMLLSKNYDFAGQPLVEAIKQTFAQRETPVESAPVCFSTGFAHDSTKQKQWDAFVHRSAFTQVTESFPEVVETVKLFLAPPAAAIQSERRFDANWIAGTQWS